MKELMEEVSSTFKIHIFIKIYKYIEAQTVITLG